MGHKMIKFRLRVFITRAVSRPIEMEIAENLVKLYPLKTVVGPFHWSMSKWGLSSSKSDCNALNKLQNTL